MVRRRFALLVAALVIGALAPAAQAGPAKVAVLQVEIGGDGAPELRPQLAASIAAGLANAKVKAVELDRVTAVFEDAPELAGCLSSTCLERLGNKVGADGFIRARVSADADDYKLELELYDRSQLLNKLEVSCSVCTIGELNQAAVVTTAKLLSDAPDKPVQVVIRSEPSGAKLTIDGIARGAAPFEGPLSPGSHVVVAEAEGVGRVERRVLVTESSHNEPIVIELVPGNQGSGPVDTPPVDSGDSGLGTLKWVTTGAAILALGTGATLIVLDGRGTCGESGAMECERELNTGLAGWITAGGGLVLAAAAGWMFWADRGSGEEPNRRVGVVPVGGGGVMALVGGQF